MGKKLKKNFYCGNKVDYDEQCSEQCDGCVDAIGVDYGYLEDITAQIRNNKIKQILNEVG